MIVGTREESEKLLARSLSRHIGYTSGAYHLDRIFSTLDFFRDKTSAYKEEIVVFLKSAKESDGQSITNEYLADVLSFASSMGLIEAVSAREAKLTRFAPTELGRSLLGARAVGNKPFYNFYAAQVVLRSDADFLVSILLYVKNNPTEDLTKYFVGFHTALEQERLGWLTRNFPERLLFERIADQLSWLSRKKGALRGYQIDIPTLNTARHHTQPRLGWIEQLGMYDRATKTLKPFGEDVLRALAESEEYFWLSPPIEVLESLGVRERPSGAAEDTLDLATAHADPSEEELADLIRDVASIMENGYEAAKLVHASQASLQLPIEYVRYRSYTDRRKYKWEEILEQLFQEHRGRLERFSAMKGKIGFYRVLG